VIAAPQQSIFKNYNSGAATRGLAVGRKQIQATAAPRTITPLETKRSQMVSYFCFSYDTFLFCKQI
jgi:hypothetical protein